MENEIELLLVQEKFKEAQKKIESLPCSKLTTEVLDLLAYLYMMEGKFKKAISVIELHVDKKTADWYFRCGFLLANKFEQGKATLKELNQAKDYLEEALLLGLKKEQKKIAQSIIKWIETDLVLVQKYNFDEYMLQLDILELEHDYDQIIAVIKKIPNNIFTAEQIEQLQYRLAESYCANWDYKAAMNILEKMPEVAKETSKWHYIYTKILYLNLQNTTESQEEVLVMQQELELLISAKKCWSLTTSEEEKEYCNAIFEEFLK